jgi:nucleoside-diphosphate-sugar epimerase
LTDVTRPTYDKVLITGGAGFIGSHTADVLLDNDVNVWILDDLTTGSLRNLKRWKNHKRLHFLKGSITRWTDVKRAAKPVEAIIHLAALTSPKRSILLPEETFHVNVTGTANLLHAAKVNEIQRFVYASSCAVYGNATVPPIPESASQKPTTPYAASKMIGEKCCSTFAEAYDLDTVALRYFNVYGPKQNPAYAGVITKFAKTLLAGSRATIHGNGEQTRDFINISDVVTANLLALRTKRGVGQCYNIGTGQETSINQLHNVMASLLRIKTKPIQDPPMEGDVRRSCAETEKARAILGFESKTSLKLGLKMLIDSMRQSKTS